MLRIVLVCQDCVKCPPYTTIRLINGSLSIKIGPSKNLIKAMTYNLCKFQHLKIKFGEEKSDSKLKRSIFIGLKKKKKKKNQRIDVQQ